MPLVGFSVWAWQHHCTQNSNKQFLGMDMSGFAAQEPKLWPGCLWDLTGLVALQLTRQTHGLWKQGKEIWYSWLCPTGQRPFRWDTATMPSSRSKTNQIMQDIFSTVKAEYQGELSGMKRNADLHQKAKYKPIACHGFSFFFPFLYLWLWHKCPLHLFTLTWGLRLAYFICPDGLCEGWALCAGEVPVPGPTHVISYLLPPWRQAVANRRIIRMARAGDLCKVWVLS